MNPEKSSTRAPGRSSSLGAETPELACPRCDYDLRGLPAPRCPECGLQFRWEALHDIRGARASDCVEYCLRERPLRSLARTWWRALHPAAFWDEVPPSWPVQGRPLLVYGIVLVVLAVLGAAAVSSSLHFATLHWFHGGRHSLSVYVPVLLHLYTLKAIFALVPAFASGILLCFAHSALRRMNLGRRRLARLVVYPMSFLVLLPIAIPARIFATMLVYASSPIADWSVLFWWIVPGGQWSGRVLLQMLPFGGWYTSHFQWSHGLRVLTLAGLGIVLLSVVLPALVGLGRNGQAWLHRTRWLGLIVLAILWPVSMVYVGWLASLVAGTDRYLGVRWGWAVGLATGSVGLLCWLLLDTLLGGWVLLDLVQVWP